MAGTLTKVEMRAAVLDNLGRSSNLTLRSGTALVDRIDIWLNWAQIYIARKHDFLFRTATTSTVVNQDCYTFPPEFNAIYTIRLEDGLQSTKLTLVMPWDFDRIVAKPDELPTGRPYYYVPFKESGHFEIFPVPDAVYTMRIRYSYSPTVLLTGGQTSDFTGLDDVLVYYATAQGFRWLQELKDAAYWQARAKEALEEAIANVSETFPDWQPIAHGFSTYPQVPTGEYYNNPFITSDPGA